MYQWMLAAILVCGAMVFTSCGSSSSNDSPINPITPDEPEMADYAILFYGYGGGNLDRDILNNIRQFYAAAPASHEKVKIAVQYKFSSQEDFQELLNYNPAAYEDPEQRAEVESYLAVMTPWVEKWQDKCGYTFRFTVDSKKTMEQQMVSDNIHGINNDHLAFADSLTSFMDWATKTCPAKHYVLLLSDHGKGYMPNEDPTYTRANATRSFMIDYSKNEMLTMTELKYAIDKANVKPQAIYFDACLMNSMESLFELRNSTDYIVASAFLVPGLGGDYTVLTNQLANCNEDIESALKGYNKACVERWDRSYGGPSVESFFDMTVIRTRGLDGFGQKVRSFTDKLLQAYQSNVTVQQDIDYITENALKICKELPLYDLFVYDLMLAAKVPELEAPYFEMKDCYDRDCVVSHQTSAYLSAQGILGSVLLGWDGQYEEIGWDYNEYGWYIKGRYVYKPDGTYLLYDESDNVIAQGNWGGTFAGSYEQTAFDKATGWSRWIKANQQRPATMSVFTAGYNPNEPRMIQNLNK